MPQSSARLTRQPDLEKQRRLLNFKLIEFLHGYPYSSDELKEAAVYSVGSSGHRWRPILFMRVYEKLTTPTSRADALPVACAIEFLHTASLVLDDLPAMDDGTLRRGQEPCHIKFGQSRAILTAHWLCDIAQHYIHDFVPWGEISDLETAFRATKTEMIKGQILDLENVNLSEDEIIEKCRLNSGALYSFSASAPARIANISDVADILQKFGEYLGIAYQMGDDIADVMSTTQVLGKDVRKDAGKRTLPALYGVQKAIECQRLFKTRAFDEIRKLSMPTDDLVEMVDLICMY